VLNKSLITSALLTKPSTLFKQRSLNENRFMNFLMQYLSKVAPFINIEAD